MKAIRQLAPLLVLLAAAALILYGAAFHFIPVLAVQPAEPESQASPAPQITPPALGIAAAPIPQLSPDLRQTIVLSEPAAVQDVTVGGLTRSASGQVQRTYAGKPLSQCPT